MTHDDILRSVNGGILSLYQDSQIRRPTVGCPSDGEG